MSVIFVNHLPIAAGKNHARINYRGVFTEE